MKSSIDWAPPRGRELGSETGVDDRRTPWRVVACLNIWNDLPALEATLPSWYDHVDAVIAVDGAYASTDRAPLSTDGTREFLAGLAKVQLLDVGGSTQFAKRNAYLSAGQRGDLLFVIDADEVVAGADRIRSAPNLDVGWVRLASRLYRVPYGQPRLFRWRPELRYAGRHHWVYAGDRLLATHQYGGHGFEHRTVAVTLENRRGLGHTPDRVRAKRTHAVAQLEHEAPAFAMPSSRASDSKLGGREALRIAMIALRDDGIAPSRLHTAINRTTPHSSLFFKSQPGPFEVEGQYSTHADSRLFREAVARADVLHHHVTLLGLPSRTTLRQSLVFHHHGTMLRQNAAEFNRAARTRGALVLVSNLELLSHAPGAEFLPNPVPVARYRQLIRPPAVGSPLRIGHSPSKPGRKGTEHFTTACERLKARGIEVEPVIIHGVSHRESLRLKASCDACFDSFWLGMQCSGVEAGAMGQPVIAGDPEVAQRYRDRFGSVPWTYANDGEELEGMIEKLASDSAFFDLEAARVSAFVLEHHDESAVALRYLDLLDDAFGWR